MKRGDAYGPASIHPGVSLFDTLPDLADPYAAVPPEHEAPGAGHIVIEPPDDGPVG